MEVDYYAGLAKDLVAQYPNWVAVFALVLAFWVIDWLGQSMGPRGEAVLKYLSMTVHLDDFVKGVIDTKHLIYYLSFITFGLFLTIKSVDTERWRG